MTNAAWRLRKSRFRLFSYRLFPGLSRCQLRTLHHVPSMILLVGSLCYSWSSFALSPSGNEIDYSNASLRLGKGYDAVSGADKGECVSFSGIEPFSGLETLLEIKQIEHTDTLSQEMSLSASAALKFEVGSGSSKAEFVQSQSVTSYSTFVLVKAIVRAPVQNAVHLDYAPGFSRLLKNANGQNQFRSSCGDYFVGGYISGGEFFGVIQIESTDQVSKQSLEDSLKASYGVFNSALEFKQKLERVVKDREVRIRAYQGGGNPKILIPTADGLIKVATEFPTAFVDYEGKYNGRGVVYRLLLQPYSNLPLPEGAIVAPIVATNQVQVLDRLSQFASAFNQQINDINYILGYPERFVDPDPKALTTARNKIIEMKNTVIAKAQACFSDSMSCTDDPTISFLPVKFPEMKGGTTCKNPIYNEKTDPKCGMVFKEGTGSECGQKCTSKSDPRCGIARWNSGSSPVCPPIYQLAANGACGAGHQECSLGPCPHPNHGNPCVSCRLVYPSCRAPGNGIEGYETCENPAFGIREYASCQVCDGFQTCKHPNFGIDHILSCRLPEFGMELCADKP